MVTARSRFRESVVNYIRHYAILGGILICVLLYILIAKNVYDLPLFSSRVDHSPPFKALSLLS